MLNLFVFEIFSSDAQCERRQDYEDSRPHEFYEKDVPVRSRLALTG